MRVVLDTNIVVSALVWGGVPFRLLQLAQAGEIEIVVSPFLISELIDVLSRTHFATRIARQNISPTELVTQYQSMSMLVSPTVVPVVILNDRDDDHVLACALTGGADLIVSGDKHLHRLGGQYNDIRIVNAGEAVRIIEAALLR
jgi:uncharacterized protein